MNPLLPRGGQLPGEAHPRARLKDADVIAIRRLLDRGAGVVEVAYRYSVSHQHVSNIRQRKRRWNV